MFTIADKITTMGNLLPNETIDDGVARTFLAMAGEAILNKLYPFKEAIFDELDPIAGVPNRYALLQCQVAVYLYNKQGAEGETQHNENGINRTYESASVPDSMLKDVIPYAKVF